MPISLICLDADDTLWHHERFFQAATGRLSELLAEFAETADLNRRLLDVEHRNLGIYGYGVKSFILSVIETAIEIVGDRLPARTIEEILTIGRSMMQHPIELIDGVTDSLDALAQRGRLVLVTKGDLFHQEAKLTASGLGAIFAGVEIVSAKAAGDYRRVFARYATPASEAIMAGNSVRSDVLPPLEAGAYAAYVPYPLLWDHEAADLPQNHSRFRQLESLRDLPGWIDEIAREELPS